MKRQIGVDEDDKVGGEDEDEDENDEGGGEGSKVDNVNSLEVTLAITLKSLLSPL